MNGKPTLLLFIFTLTILFNSAILAQEMLMHKVGNNNSSLLFAMNNPCNNNPCNPCATATSLNAKKVLRPSWFNGLYDRDSRTDLAAYGEQLFNDTSLGSNGVKCSDCHAESKLFKPSFLKPYPHKVDMAKQRAGITRAVHADEFVQFCINVPLAGNSLPWKSKKLASLTAYILDVAQPAYINKLSDLGFSKNPCATNPCNPCAGKVLGAVLEQESNNNLLIQNSTE